MNRKNASKFMIVLFFLAFLVPAGLCADKSKEIEIGGYGYVISVPEKWHQDGSEDEESIKVHLIDPEGKAKGHFTVHVMARNGRALDEWVDYHLKVNISQVHGFCRVESRVNIFAGSYEGKMIHATELERHEKYDLCETILVTNSHIITFSYLHGHDRKEAGERMSRIIGSFHTRTMTDYCGSPYYEEGRALGLEDFGLFLRLPRGWMPQERSKEGIAMDLPQGKMTVYTFKRVSRGIKGLKKLVAKSVPGLADTEKLMTTTFGRAFDEAFRVSVAADGESSGLDCYLGLHGRGGYALVLEVSSDEEKETFRRVAGEAVLLEPSKVKSRFRSESNKLKKVFRAGDKSELCPPLTLLSLFSDSRSAALAIGTGLKSPDPVIQTECARALGRMGCEDASLLLETALGEGSSSLEVKAACIRALGVNHGERGKEILINFRKGLSGSEDARELIELLDSAIAG